MEINWRERPERGGRRITRFYIWLSLTVGRRLARPILYGIALYFFVSAPAERWASQDYLARVLRRRPTLFQRYKHFFIFCTLMMDKIFFLAHRTKDVSFCVHGVEVFESLVAEKKGFLLASGHIGSFEALRALGISEKRHPVKALIDVETSRRFYNMLRDINPEVVDSVIPLGQPGAVLEIREWIDSGGVVGILADRWVSGDRVTPVDFLGSPANFPIGPWRLASVLNVPVVLCFAVYSGKGQYDAYFELLSPADYPERAQREEHARKLAIQFAARLEHFCRMTPYNWANLLNFWARTDESND